MRNEVISSQLNNIDDVKNLCQLKLDGITYQKHMTQHILDEDLSWTESLCNCFLIRDPKEVVISFKNLGVRVILLILDLNNNMIFSIMY